MNEDSLINAYSKTKQTHRHIHTCYRSVKDKKSNNCTLNTSYQPIKEARKLTPLTKDTNSSYKEQHEICVV